MTTATAKPIDGRSTYTHTISWRMTMRQATILVMLLLAACAHAQIHLTASLTGTDEATPVVTTASGTGSFVFNQDLTELKYVVSYQGLSGTLTAGGHFHVGTPGKIRTDREGDRLVRRPRIQHGLGDLECIGPSSAIDSRTG